MTGRVSGHESTAVIVVEVVMRMWSHPSNGETGL